MFDPYRHPNHDHGDCMIDSLTGRHVYTGGDWMNNPHRRHSHGCRPPPLRGFGNDGWLNDKYRYSDVRELPEKPLGEHGPAADHLGFWDSVEAEREYNGLCRALSELVAKQTKMQPAWEQRKNELQSRRSAYQTASLKTAGLPAAYQKDEDLNALLNPYWLYYSASREGLLCRLYSGGYRQAGFEQGEGHLIVQNVESETIREPVVFGIAYFGGLIIRDRKIQYSFEKWFAQYRPVGDAAKSMLEDWPLRDLLYTKDSSGLADSSLAELLVQTAQEVIDLIAPLKRQMVLTFYPDLAPVNIGEISKRVYDVGCWPALEYPPLGRYNVPTVGGRYGLDSYKGLDDWLVCGRWLPHRFKTSQLENVRSSLGRITQRLKERIGQIAQEEVAVVYEMARIEEEVALVRRRIDMVRSLHYKPQAYLDFWQSAEKATEQARIAAPESAVRVRIPQTAQSRSDRNIQE